MTFSPFKVIVNLCFSNLLSAVVVKSISIVHNAYAGDRIRLSLLAYPIYSSSFSVASNVQESNIAFCILYTWGWRLTWAVLPLSIVAMSWLSIVPRFKRLQVGLTKWKHLLFTRCKGWNLGKSNKQIFCDNYEIPCIF